MTGRTLWLLLLPLALAGFPAFGRPDPAPVGVPVGVPVGGAGGLPVAAGPGSGQIVEEVKVEAGEFGTGNVCRAGEWCGLRLRLTDSAPKQREVLIRVVLDDADGDRPAYSRVLTLNPGVTQDAWIYFRLPFWFKGGDSVLVLANEPIADSREVTGSRAGRLLARRQILPNGRVHEADTPMIGVVGPNEMGLRQYYAAGGNGMATYPLMAHELIDPVSALTSKGLPDRWMGLGQFETIVWGESPSGGETDISRLRGESTKAIREWVMRGGHLVIVLPPTGQAWTNPATNELMDILPAVNIRRRESVDLSEYRALLTRAREGVLPRSAVLHSFEPLPNAAPQEAIKILNGPQGDCVVVRRLVGIGQVTLVGFDFSSRMFSAGGLLDADVFWHRVLGKRGILNPDQKEVVSRGQMLTVDSQISSQIAKRGTAATGMLMGVGVFILYWVLAGPLGFGVLKARRATRLAWLTFLGTAVAFTGIAFGAATWFRPRRFEASHLSILDHVYGQNVQRVRSWLSLMLPKDGTVEVVAPDSEGQPEAPGAKAEFGGVLSPWDPVGSQQRSGFLDAREYQIDGRNPTRLDVPARSTVKQMQLDWAGSPRWGMPHPTGPEGVRADGAKLKGELVHDLPGAMHDLLIVHVWGQQPYGSDIRSRIVSRVQFWKYPSEWQPGTPLDLELQTGQAAAAGAGELYLSGLVPMSSGGYGMGSPADSKRLGSIVDVLTMTSVFSELGIPEEAKGNHGQAVSVLRRDATQCMDLAEWFTQPCVMIIGFVGNGSAPAAKGQPGAGSEPPVSVSIGGRAVPGSGMTMVRWVYPLGPMPPAFKGASESSDPN
ncbi:MAG: hypothetical protein U0573_09805 [Phycisphaerales bacterium]|nr:hypothetical protein [Planctomycetota bacterium]